MTVNPDYAGRSYPQKGPFAVDAAMIGAFARAVGATDPVHTDSAVAQAAGYRDVIAPPTMAVRFAQQCSAEYVRDPGAGIDYSRVVHGEEGFVHHRPITAGDQLVGILTVDAVRQAGGHSMISTRCELADAQGDPVCTETSTIVVRGGE